MPNMQEKKVIQLAVNASVTGNPMTWPGGDGTFSGEGTFGGGTITLQVQVPGTETWMAVGSDTTLTAAGIAGFTLPKGALIRVAIATATAVYAYAVPFEG